MTPATWTHKGQTITFDGAKAKFCATVGRKSLSAPSLDAIKKKIDVEVTFQEFPCYLELTGWEARDRKGAVAILTGGHTGARALFEGTVTGREKPGGRSFGGAQWRVAYKNEKGNATTRFEATVLPQTPEALAAWKLHWETREQCEEAERQLADANKAKLEPLREAVPYRRAESEG